ncbi:hypothetical protein DRN86_05090 [Candidatus Geothermarchaeota archaeon]|nr:MAG: hypothetical protein DRN86_05090 [Candidatus Geothermarchaeota archaeon]
METKIYLTRDVKEYRKIAKELVSKDDIVLEVGCGFGKTSFLLSKIAKRVVGIDKSKEAIENAKKLEGNNLKFYLMDANEVRKLLRLREKFSVILLDISGSARPWEVLRLSLKLIKVFEPRVLIIKNWKLKRFFERVEN